MKRISTVLALMLALCMVLSLGAFASAEPSAEPSGEPSGEASGEAVVPGTYTDGEHTLVIADDFTFSMDKTGQNMEGEDFVLTVTGTVTEDGVFTVTGLFDGDINLVEVASAEQIAADLATVEEVYAAATASGEPSGEAAPITINADGTFVLESVGQNMDGAEFVKTITGILNDDGTFTLTGIYDGDLNVLEMASEDQLAGDYAVVEAALAG